MNSSLKEKVRTLVAKIMFYFSLMLDNISVNYKIKT